MIKRIIRVWRRPLSRNLQYLSFRWALLIGFVFYRPRLRFLGKNSYILKPLFWTPEFISIGNNVFIWPGCRMEALETGCGKPALILADGVTIQQNCHITAGGVIEIGEGTTILYGAMITDMDHRYEDFGVRVSDQPIIISQTCIGKNCFIGAGAKIFPGTILGDQCIVGANAVVRGIYPAGSVIVGAPGRVVKKYDSSSGNWVRSPA